MNYDGYRRHTSATARLALTALALGLMTGVATAQAPTAEQKKQVQSACAADFKKLCRGVKPGGEEALDCLNKNAGTLSDACWGAVSALNPQQGQPDGNSSQPAAGAPANEAPATGAPAGGAPAADGGDAGPTPEQLKEIQSACAADFKKSCSGAKPGGPEALDCLNKNAATLSDACWGAVSAATPQQGQPPADGAPPPSDKQGAAEPPPPPSAAPSRPAAPPPAAAAAPPPRQPLSLPPLGPRVAAFVVRACEGDRVTVCANVPMGGGRILQCLARNVDRVSRRCRIALERAANM